MKKMKINDNEMYQYFDCLFYGSSETRSESPQRGLRQEWKKTGLIEPYDLTNYDVYEMLGAKRLLYGGKDAKLQLCVLDSMQKLLHEYVGIRGLEELLINNYGSIENAIFFEHDAKGDPVHIREHAKHQMKNAYLGSRLLLECGYLEDAAKNILAGESSVTAYLTYQAIVTVVGNADSTQSHEELMARLKKHNLYENVLGKLEEWVYKIFMISSMLHDIGYPLEFYLRSARTLAEYPPYLNILSPAAKTDFVVIKSSLLESQLFRLTDHGEIRMKYDANNHGVLSAVSLLMYFYHNGKIYSMSREERCLIEVSAIAIYRHTDKFNGKSRFVYRKDPISYLVRLCDDLQEWERFKVILNDKHNYLQCGTCGKLILSNEREYQCECCGQKYYKVTQINNRKVNYICLCDELEVEQEENRLLITVKFDLMKQFEILPDDYTAVLRHKDNLDKIRKMLRDQSMEPELAIDYFVSNNPDVLIEQMLEMAGLEMSDVLEWAESFPEEKRRKNMIRFAEDYIRNGNSGRFGEALEKNGLKYREAVETYVKSYYGEVYSLYVYCQEMEKRLES